MLPKSITYIHIIIYIYIYIEREREREREREGERVLKCLTNQKVFNRAEVLF